MLGSLLLKNTAGAGREGEGGWMIWGRGAVATNRLGDSA